MPGQARELAPSLHSLADMACHAVAFRSAAGAMGATPVVSSRKSAKAKKPRPASSTVIAT
jgi:hypothetical protein